MNNQLDNKRAVMYLRILPGDQAENISLQKQEKLCKEQAIKKGYRIIKTFKEDSEFTESLDKRPALIQLIEYCTVKENRIKAVFVFKLDRIAKETNEYFVIRKKLSENNIALISTFEPKIDTSNEKFIETMLASFAQLDSDIRSGKIKV